jgi:ParB family transcriptional regulator, chromosome partitioning protein
MMIALDDISLNGNMRKVAPTPAEDAALMASIAELGVLQPVIVRPDPDRNYVLIAGYRRYNAARALGHMEIPAEVKIVSDLQAEAAQAAENMVRCAVDPVDQWKHIHRLVQDGYTLASAGAALGLTDREIGQRATLGRLAPELLECLAGRALPPWRTLGEIATAPHEQQVACLKRYDHGYTVGWHSIAAECIQRRIPRDRALFDVETAGVLFEEDLFAEPGSPEQWTTLDLLGFMRAQRTAVEALIADGEEPALLVDYNPTTLLPKLPVGWQFADSTGGAERALTRRSRHKRAYCIVPATDYHDAGTVKHVIIKPVVAKKDEAGEVEDDRPDDKLDEYSDDIDGTGPAEDDPGTDVVQITHAGQDMLAEIRTAALCRALRNLPPLDAGTAATVLLLHMVSGDYRLRDILARIVSPDGDITVPDRAALVELIGEAIARTIHLTPIHRQNHVSYSAESYQKGEWIGALIEADYEVPRLDTPEFLANVNGKTLQAIAADCVSPSRMSDAPKKVAELRRWLAGKAELWRPIQFGAPGTKCQPWFPAQDGQEDAA